MYDPRPMPENARDLYARSVDDLQTPAVDTWDTWPFAGAIRPRALAAPSDEPVRQGEGGVACPACTKPDSDYLWTDDTWRLLAPEPGGLPVVVLVEPRAHYDGPADMPDDALRDMGAMLGRVERAVLSVGNIGRVHIGRWGEGAAHLHWWFIARPAGFPQLASSMAEIWNDVLPPTPDEVWRDNLARVVAALRAGD
jgi:diadenosine tetraphosphate (Ap4A) HIT family hydrolase